MRCKAVILIGLFIGTLSSLFLLNFTYSIPEVLVSYSSGECTKVINFVETDRFSCENLPMKYDQVWVK